uniref:Uncharacterized protein n=1 Tax=Ciona savignyi TaxID=51511 RepID=H2ZQ82_CIOSA
MEDSTGLARTPKFVCKVVTGERLLPIGLTGDTYFTFDEFPLVHHYNIPKLDGHKIKRRNQRTKDLLEQAAKQKKDMKDFQKWKEQRGNS